MSDARPSGRLESRILIGVVIGAALYLVLAVVSGVDELSGALRTFAPTAFAVALGLALVNYALRFARQQLYLRLLGVEVPVLRSAVAFVAAFSLTVTPGKMGELLKAWLLHRSDGVSLEAVSGVVIVERLTDVLALAVWVAIGAVSVARADALGPGAAARLAAIAVGLVLVAVVALSSERVMQLGVSIVARLPVVGRFADRIRALWTASRTLLRPGPLVAATVLATIGWGLEGVLLMVLLQGFGEAAPLGPSVFVYALTTLAGAVSFSPGGLGVTDVSMGALLHTLGLAGDVGVAGAATFLTRLATLWFAVALGVVALVAYRWIWMRGDTVDVAALDALSGGGDA